jgi:transcriptional regulator with PAS, ATPase and Fis domain
MDVAIQVKLLKALEEKSVRRLGGLRAKNVNARIIAATNRDLPAAIGAGKFRADPGASCSPIPGRAMSGNWPT